MIEAPPDALSARDALRMDSPTTREISSLLRTMLSGKEIREAGALRLLERHRREVDRALAESCGYLLRIDRSAARLVKVPPQRPTCPPLRASRNGQRQPFDARRYRVLFAALTVLSNGADRGRTQWQLAALLDALVEEAADAGIHIDLTDGEDRRRVVRDVLTALVDELGVLVHLDGDSDPLASERWRERAGALYDLDEAALDRLIALGDMADSVQAAIDAARAPLVVRDQPRLSARRQLLARLLEEPVVYTDELDAAQADVLRRDGRQLIETSTSGTLSLSDLFGLQPERRQEGICLIDSGDHTTDPADRFPARSKDRQCALLLAAHLARTSQLGPAAQRAALASLIRDYAQSWSVDPSDQDQVAAMAHAAGWVLVEMRLASRADDGTLTALAAVARFAELELRTDADDPIRLF